MGRRPKGQPPQMRKGTSRGYDYAYVYVDGGKVRLGRWNSPEARKHFRAIVVEWERRHADTSQYRPSGPLVTVADLVLAFMAHAAVYYRHEDGTPTSEQRAFKTSLSPLLDRQYAGKPVDDFRPKDLMAIVNRWIAAGLTRKTINKMAGRIKHAFDWAIPEELVGEATAALVRSVKLLAKGRTLAPDFDDVPPAPFGPLLLTFAWGMDERQQLITMIQMRTGARPDEVCRIRGSEIARNGHVKIGKREVRVPTMTVRSRGGKRVQTVVPWAWVPGQHKTKWRGKRVVYLMGPKLQRILTPYLAKAGDGYLFPGLLTSEHQRADAHASKMKATCERIGVEPWTPAQLRHNVLSRRDKKSNIEAASISVGHSSIAVTEIYAERDIGRAAELAARWD